MTQQRFAVVVLLLSGCLRSGLEVMDDGGPARDGDGPGPGVQVLIVDFATPHGVCWSWDADALDPPPDGYVLWYGPSIQAVRQMTSQASAWGVNEDPNLAWRFSPFGPNLVERTTVSDLSPASTYYAALRARYDDRPQAIVAEGIASTPTVPANEVIFFSDSLDGGWSLTFEDTLSDHAHGGSSSLVMNTTGGWINGTVGGLNRAIVPMPTAWQGAYIDLYIDVAESDEGHTWPIHYLEIAVGGIEQYRFSLPYYVTLPFRSGWHRLQVPVTHLFRDSVRLSDEGLEGVFNWFQLGADFGSHRYIYIDDVVLKYD